VPIGVVWAEQRSGPVVASVLAWPEQATDPRSYELTAAERTLQPGPFGVLDEEENAPVRVGELYLLEQLVARGDSGTAVVDPAGAIVGVVSRGLRASEVPEPPEDAEPDDFVGGVWATVGSFCERILSAPGELLVSTVVDWRLQDGDPTAPADTAEQSGVDAVRALCGE